MTNATLLLATWLAPLVAIPLALRATGRWWVPVAALPALATALLVPVGTGVDWTWLLLGARFGLSAYDPIFLAFGAVLWLVAGWYAAVHLGADAQAARFRVFFLLAMSGNFGLIVGQDLVSFYLGFSVMGLAAYGLVVHEGDALVRRAGRIYLLMTLIGEVALFCGLAFLYLRVGSLVPAPATLAGAGGWELSLLSLGFGIKAGLIGLHVWLPLAHPAAPIAASAVLSGAMIKAALVGWLRYLPLGQQAMPDLGVGLIAAGVVTALSAVVLGVGQRDPKVVLAYSSIGKMGTLVAGLGVAAIDPEIAPAIILALSFYAAHHGLAKGALFLGVGVVKASASRWPLWLLMLPALVLIGVPLTSGALAKGQFKTAVLQAPSAWADVVVWALPLIAVGTTLLMGRFIYLMSRLAGSSADPPRPTLALALPWLGLIALGLGLAFLYAGASGFVSTDLRPLLIGALLTGLLALRCPAWLAGWIGRVPPGDLVVLLESAGQRLSARLSDFAAGVREWFRNRIANRRPAGIGRLFTLTSKAETALAEHALSGAAWLTLAGIALVLLVLP
jgi:formate hydrogenlyase subunit 3/multisubunit Na+/H+ antiporter MnhD subunit